MSTTEHTDKRFSAWGHSMLVTCNDEPHKAQKDIADRLLRADLAPEERNEAAMLLALALLNTGTPCEALEALVEIESSVTEQPNTAQQAYFYILRGSCYQHLGEMEQALADHRLALRIALDAGDTEGVARAHGNLAGDYELMGRSAEAIQSHYLAIESFRASNNVRALATLYGNLGITLERIGEYSRAAEEFIRAIELEEQYGGAPGKARHYLNLGSLYFLLKDYQRSFLYYNKALALGENIPGTRSTEARGALAMSLFKLGRQGEAIAMYQEVIQELRSRKRIPVLASMLINAATDLDEAGNKDQAVEYLNEAIQIGRQSGMDTALAYALYVLTRVQKDTMSPEECYTTLCQAARLADNNQEDPAVTGAIRQSLAEYCSQLGKYEEACTHFTEAIRKEQKRSDEQARAHLVQLEADALIARVTKERNEVQSQKQELEQLTYRLNEAVAERDMLIGMVSHDLRSPLGIIINMAELIDTNPADPQSAELKQQLIDTGWDMSDLIEKLLDLNRLRRDSLNVEIEPCIVSDLVHGVAQLYMLKAKEKNIHLSVEADAALPAVATDVMMADKIVGNLLSNALKFTPTGGRVEVYAKQLDNTVTLYVQDTGQGIPRQEHDKLFTPFSKISTRPTDGEPSSGLGLSIVADMAKRINGLVRLVDSSPQGSTFAFSMPVYAGEESEIE